VVDRVVEDDLEQLQAEQEPVILRRAFKNPSTRRTSVTSSRTIPDFKPSEPFSVSAWFKVPKPPVIVREGNIRVGSEHEPDSQGR